MWGGWVLCWLCSVLVYFACFDTVVCGACECFLADALLGFGDCYLFGSCVACGLSGGVHGGVGFLVLVVMPLVVLDLVWWWFDCALRVCLG